MSKIDQKYTSVNSSALELNTSNIAELHTGSIIRFLTNKIGKKKTFLGYCNSRFKGQFTTSPYCFQQLYLQTFGEIFEQLNQQTNRSSVNIFPISIFRHFFETFFSHTFYPCINFYFKMTSNHLLSSIIIQKYFFCTFHR